MKLAVNLTAQPKWGLLQGNGILECCISPLQSGLAAVVAVWASCAIAVIGSILQELLHAALITALLTAYSFAETAFQWQVVALEVESRGGDKGSGYLPCTAGAGC